MFISFILLAFKIIAKELLISYLLVPCVAGAVSDTKYNSEGAIFKKQSEYSESDWVNGENIPFTNITNKGYRLQLAAGQHGHQTVLLPDFKKLDEKFSDKQTISSAAIAKDRSSNKRAVRLAKKARYLNIAIEGSAD